MGVNIIDWENLAPPNLDREGNPVPECGCLTEVRMDRREGKLVIYRFCEEHGTLAWKGGEV